MMRFDLSNFISYAILLITLSSVTLWISLPIGNTFIWWGIFGSILISFLASKNLYYDRQNDENIKMLLVYLGWNLICILRGTWVAENYWEWKFLVGSGMVLLLPVSIYVTSSPELVQKILSVWIRFALPGFFLLLPFFIAGDALGRYLVPICFLLLFIGVLPDKWKIVMVIFSVGVIFAAPDARSNVIKFGVCILLGLLFYLRRLIPLTMFALVRWLLLAMPVVLFCLAITGKFNVFKMDEYLAGDFTTTVTSNGEEKEENLITDTRTALYEEVLASALKYDYVLSGRTPARGNESPSFGDYSLEVLRTGKMERFSNEVSILNIFTWTGAIGVFLYFFIFYKATRLAVYSSNSIFMRIVGINVAFRWAYAWVEDFSDFDLSYFFLWVMIGMCFSKSFLLMTDSDVEHWIWGIFDKRYREIYIIKQPMSEIQQPV